MTKKDQVKVQEILNNTLTLLGLTNDQIEIDDQNDEFSVKINLPDNESGLFIGYQGETLSSLQLLLSLMVSERLGSWHRVKIDVGDYRERRQQVLFDKADEAARKAVESGQEIILPNLNSFERHAVHEHLTQNPDVTTESRGVEPYRQLYVLPK